MLLAVSVVALLAALAGAHAVGLRSSEASQLEGGRTDAGLAQLVEQLARFASDRNAPDLHAHTAKMLQQLLTQGKGGEQPSRAC